MSKKLLIFFGTCLVAFLGVAFWVLIKAPRVEPIASIPLRLNISSEGDIYISELKLSKLPISEKAHYAQRNLRLAVVIKSQAIEFRKNIDCFSYLHPKTNEVRNIFIANKYANSEVVLNSNNGFEETIVMEYISDVSAKDLQLEDFEFSWKC